MREKVSEQEPSIKWNRSKTLHLHLFGQKERQHQRDLRGVLPGADDAVAVARKEGVRVRAPGDREADGAARDGGEVLGLAGELGDAGLLLEVKDLDALRSGGAEPVLGRVEDDLVHLAAGVELVEALALLEVPDDDLAVLARRRAERALGRHADGVDVAGVADEVELELEIVEAPDLHETVPAARHEDGHGRVRRERDVRDPLGVRVFDKVVLAVAEGVPQLDAAVAAARHDLAVVRRERDGGHVLRVAHEAAHARAVRQVPQAERAVPAARQRVAAVVRHLHALDKVAVAVETALRVGVLLHRARQLPHHDRLIPRTRDKQVRALASGGQ